MAPVTPIRPMADGTLIEFFLGEAMLLSGRRLRRVEAAHAALLACFDEHAPDLLLAADGRSLKADRHVGEPGAIVRVVPPRTILDVLPLFLAEPRWHGEQLQDRRIRSQLAWKLAQHVGWQLDLRGSEPYEAVRIAVRRSRTAIRRVEAEAATARLAASGISIELPAWPTPSRDLSAVPSGGRGPITRTRRAPAPTPRP